MQLFTLILCALAIIATGLPLINSAAWWIRIFDFPRVQIAFFTLGTIILAFVYLDFDWVYKLTLLLLLGVSLVYQLHFVVVYTPLYRTQAKDSNKPIGKNNFTILSSNVRMDNDEKERFNKLVKKHNPDIILITEPNNDWAASINKLEKDYPYAVKYPLENTFGMMLLSKLPLTESAVNFIVNEDVPSIVTRFTLPSGSLIDLYGIHPVPPKPGTASYERDTELLIIGKKIKGTKNPTIVAGDLNDVGWSNTSKLFRKYSGLVDPREGRGLYNTYNVNVPLLRFPLDHIFYSKEFGLLSLEKLEDIGSDHYPLLISLNYEPDSDNTEDLKKTNISEEARIDEKINDDSILNEKNKSIN